MFIRQTPGGDPVAVHPLSHGKGQLIKNTNHARDRSKGIPALLATVKAPFKDQEKMDVFLEKIQARYPRYVRDQCHVLQRAIKTNETWIDQALDMCTEAISSVQNVRDVERAACFLAPSGNTRLDISRILAGAPELRTKATGRKDD